MIFCGPEAEALVGICCRFFEEVASLETGSADRLRFEEGACFGWPVLGEVERFESLICGVLLRLPKENIDKRLFPATGGWDSELWWNKAIEEWASRIGAAIQKSVDKIAKVPLGRCV